MPSSRTRKILIALIVLAVVIATPILVLKNQQSQPVVEKNLAVMKEVGVGISMYAKDHNRALPKIMHDLVPEYFVEDGWEFISYRNRTGQPQEWLYYYSPKRFDELPPDYILLASPEVLNVDNFLGYGGRKMRVVCFADLEPKLIPEAEFKERIAKQESSNGGLQSR